MITFSSLISFVRLNKTFKGFYLGYISKHLQSDFPDLISYNRMVELSLDKQI